ncbi:MAG: hypothetical protein IPN75_04620 [Dechloromonas sp.]|mgnify:CR=1 FL=1|uniref:Lactoylglutathione lyase n=1 Tax=Candidatus Dechloromonas phosphorivorans TaxID=2899244 RepID=A0A9D7QI27_9RHOO|nr:hypothetical protein [Candidatus Dechloromonas phosphorivorans]
MRSCAHVGQASVSPAFDTDVLRMQLLRRSVYPEGRLTLVLAVLDGKVVREAGPMKHGKTVIAFVEDPDGYNIDLKERSTRDS